MPVPQVSIGDQIEIAISCNSLRGVVNVDSIKWNPIILSGIYKENAITYNKDTHLYDTGSVYTKIVANLSRICEEEDAELDWLELKYIIPSEKRKLFSIQLLKNYFDVKKVLCAGVDVMTSKYFLVATAPQIIDENVLGIGIKIVNEQESCLVEVKKLGLLIDWHTQMEMRVGDILVFYFTKD